MKHLGIKKGAEMLLFFAVRTGLEPATPCVTGMYSNQLNYRTVITTVYSPLRGCKYNEKRYAPNSNLKNA